jgi:hypothetical protein
MNPPQLSREDRWVAGCSCGGLHWHAMGCTLLALPAEERVAAIEAAEQVTRAYCDALNARLRAWEETHRG